MKNWKFLAIVMAIAFVALPLLAAGPDAAAIYKSKCAMCHAANGSGDTPTGKSMKVRDLRSDEVQKKTDEQIEKSIENGKGKMPAYKSKLSDEEIDALVKFIRDLVPKKK